MRTFIFFRNMAIFLFFLILSSKAERGNPVNILPVPQIVESGAQSFSRPGEIVLYAEEAFKNEALRLKTVWESEFRLKVISGDKKAANIWLVAPDNSPAAQKIRTREEAYVLRIGKEKTVIMATDAAGIFYGLQSLLQVWRASRRLPELTLIDWPDMKMRGITDDISRGQVSTPENVRKIIRFLASMKMNVYMPYLEDLFPFSSYPDIGRERGLYSVQQWRELQAYADSFHVQIIPIFQTLGHYENLLIQDKYRSLAEYPGGASLQVNNEATYAFLEKVIDEIVPVFKSVYFHIGADESWDVGKHATAALTRRNGLGSVHAAHYRRVYDMLKKHGKKVMMYGDIILKHPEILTEIPDDIIMFDWHYYPRQEYPSVELFRKAGRAFIVSPGIHNWRRFFPNITDALANIRTLTVQGYKNGALGSITSNWGDYGGMNLRELNYYGNAFSGAVSWNVRQTGEADFNRRFFDFFLGGNAPLYGAVYALLNDMSDRAEWLSMVSQPFYPLAGDKINELRRASALPRQAEDVLALLKKARPPRNGDHVAYLDFSARLYRWYGRLARLKLDMYDYGRDKDFILPVSALYSPEELSARARALAAEVEALSGEYAVLWKKTNLPHNLQRMTALWERVALELRVKADELQKGDASFNGQLATPFIGLPTDDPKQAVPVLYLRKTFMTDNRADEARIQLISGSHARLYVNGRFVGEVFARKTLSALVENERVKEWDISGLLKSGRNVIALEVRNYTGKRAMANVLLSAREGKQWQNLVATDRYWLAAGKKEPGWEKGDFDDSAWLNAVIENPGWLISKPRPAYDLPSRIEFFSGYGH